MLPGHGATDGGGGGGPGTCPHGLGAIIYHRVHNWKELVFCLEEFCAGRMVATDPGTGEPQRSQVAQKEVRLIVLDSLAAVLAPLLSRDRQQNQGNAVIAYADFDVNLSRLSSLASTNRRHHGGVSRGL